MNNKSVGTAFEQEFAQILSRHGFWVHCLQDNRNGQPFDVIAAKDGVAFGFDCKDCQSRRFPFSRIEENQLLAMRHWEKCGNGDAFFAIRMPETGIRLLPYSIAISLMDRGFASIKEDELFEWTMELNTWRMIMYL